MAGKAPQVVGAETSRNRDISLCRLTKGSGFPELLFCSFPLSTNSAIVGARMRFLKRRRPHRFQSGLGSQSYPHGAFTAQSLEAANRTKVSNTAQRDNGSLLNVWIGTA
jgi:hypothetical protein